MTHADYLSVYHDSRAHYAETRRIGSKRHQLFTYRQKKLAMCVFEDKRVWVEPNRSLPYGHHSLPPVEPKLPLACPYNANVLGDDSDDDDDDDDVVLARPKRQRRDNSSSSSSGDDDDDNNDLVL